MLRLCLSAIVLVLHFAATVEAGTLTLASHIRHAQVIEGFTNPIDFAVRNTASGGADASFEVSMQYAPPEASWYLNFPTQFFGTIPANGGTVPATESFLLNTKRLGGGDVAVKVTLKEVGTGEAITLGGSFKVLHHASPGLFIFDTLVDLRSKNVIEFDTGPGIPSSGTGASAPGMQGRSPTSTLNIDEITSTGSPAIISDLSPQTNLPSESEPSLGAPFTIYCPSCAVGQTHSTTFHWWFSDGLNDGQVLPGAHPSNSHVLSFNVTIEVMEDRARWTITTPGAVPEPCTIAIFVIANGWIISCPRMRRGPRPAFGRF